METNNGIIENGEMNGTETGAVKHQQQEPSKLAVAFDRFGRAVVRFKTGKTTRWVYRGIKWTTIGLGLWKGGEACYNAGVKSVKPVIVTISADETVDQETGEVITEETNNSVETENMTEE